jgi:hypothetical protein
VTSSSRTAACTAALKGCARLHLFLVKNEEVPILTDKSNLLVADWPANRAQPPPVSIKHPNLLSFFLTFSSAFIKVSP